MKLNCSINIPHLSRVEGHGNIRIRIEQGVVREAQWEVIETPRFFEAALRGKLYENAPWISGRICGICSIGHTLASIRAVERAFGFEPPAQTRKLRLLLKHMETLQSHVLHLCFLVLPDFAGTTSVIPLIESNRALVDRAAGLKLLANDLCDLVGGRRLHPTTTVTGGFTMLPDRQKLAQAKTRLTEAIPGLTEIADVLASFSIPEFSRETEFVSLRGDGEYPFIGGDLMSSDGVVKSEDEYLAMTNEYKVTQSTSKWARLSRETFAVGALARVNNNFALLHPKARELAGAFALKPVNHNPFMNNVAQLLECVHVVYDAVRLIEELLGQPWHEPRETVTPKAGRGVSAVEVPRGILYHAYEFDGDGRILSADCVIPTGQNHGNIQKDIEALAKDMAGSNATDGEIELRASMLVRAYDPCISCSVH